MLLNHWSATARASEFVATRSSREGDAIKGVWLMVYSTKRGISVNLIFPFRKDATPRSLAASLRHG